MAIPCKQCYLADADQEDDFCSDYCARQWYYDSYNDPPDGEENEKEESIDE